VSWNSSVPITFYFSQSVPDQWKNAIKKAAAVWDTPTGVQLIHVSDTVSSSTTSQNDHVNVIYWIDSGALFNYQQAQTMTRWVNNQLVDADIQVNSKDFSFFEDIPDNDREIQMESLLVHEFGHALGLKHTDNVISVMFPDLAYSQIRIDLADMDETSMKCKYQ
jgi:predicted Zn-dependent protease